MRIRAGYQIEFSLQQETVITALLNVVPERRADLEGPDVVRVHSDGVPLASRDYFVDRFGNCCLRISAPAGQLRLYNDFLIRDSGKPVRSPTGARQAALQQLPPSVIEFLLPSRYCEVDKLSGPAWSLFGSVPEGWPRVQAVLDWTQANLEFNYAHARNDRTAAETFAERRGVCRDFNHLALTLCRALNIPARYATGYLGDIGVPVNPAPMDFSACFEVYLDDAWHLVDARHNCPRIGWILLARGRDAADCAITTSFGPALLKGFSVWTTEVVGDALAPPLALPDPQDVEPWRSALRYA